MPGKQQVNNSPQTTRVNPTEKAGPFIDITEGDADIETKAKTVLGELIDVTQFALMTALGEGVNRIGKALDGIKYLSKTSLIGLDTFSYAMMIWLASVRVDKYQQRHALFNVDETKNNEYFEHEARALLDALTAKEILILIREGKSSGYEALFNAGEDTKLQLSAFESYIIDLLKHNAKAIAPKQIFHTGAKAIIGNAQLLFSRVRERQIYIEKKYGSLLDKFTDTNYIEQSIANKFHSSVGKSVHEARSKLRERYTAEDSGFTNHADKLNAEIETLNQKKLTIQNVFQYIISAALSISLDRAENLIAEITLIEKHWKKTKNIKSNNYEGIVFDFIEEQWHVIKLSPQKENNPNHEFLLQNRVKKLIEDNGLNKESIKVLKSLYHQFHSRTFLHDDNDQAYYKAQERGILDSELERTKTKIWIFSLVRKLSIIATPISLIILVATAFAQAAALAVFIPLVLVGTTSLIDEAIDIRYKFKKWRQSIGAKNEWKETHPFILQVTDEKDGKKVTRAIDIMDKIKKQIKEKNTVPKEFSKYSPEELKFLYLISINDSEAHQSKNPFDRNTRQYLAHDIQKAITLFSTPDKQGSVVEFLTKYTRPLSLDDELKQYINQHQDEVNAFRFYENGLDYEENIDNFYAAGLRYLESQCKILDQYEKRAMRRQTKFIQACFSFNGVFWGVLASMAVSTLFVAQDLPAAIIKTLSLEFMLSTGANIAIQTFHYIGFATIGIAAIASTIMVIYQLNQNRIKGELKIDEHYLHMNHVLDPVKPTPPPANATEKHTFLVSPIALMRFSTGKGMQYTNNTHTATQQQPHSLINTVKQKYNQYTQNQ